MVKIAPIHNIREVKSIRFPGRNVTLSPIQNIGGKVNLTIMYKLADEIVQKLVYEFQNVKLLVRVECIQICVVTDL